jgi:hypothetical protein
MTSASAARTSDSIALILAVAVASGIAHLGTSTMPFQVGALMDGRGLSASLAGVFGLFEIGALAISMILLSPVVHRFSSVTISLAGAALAALAHAIMFLIPTTLPPLLACATLAGIGYGLVFAAAITGASTARNPDRVYALGNVGAILFIVVMMMIIPLASARLGAMGAFPAIAALILIVAPAMLRFRSRPALLTPPPARVLSQPATIALLVMWACYSLGTGALWSFAERIGTRLAIDPEMIATILSASTACGVLGSVVAAMIGGRLPRVPAMLVGLAGTALSCVLMGYADGTVSFALGVLTYWIFYMYQYALFLGTAAMFDAEGRLGTLGGGCERLAFAVGAPIGGLIVDHGSFGMLGLLGFASCVITIPVCMPIVARTLRQRAAATDRSHESPDRSTEYAPAP